MSDRPSGIALEARSVLRSTDTGVRGAVIWVAACEFEDSDRHLGPRLLVVLGDSIHAEGLKCAVTVLVACPPDVLGALPQEIAGQVERFVVRNQGALLRHWSGEIATREMLDLLERV
jgi:hypothetical protein